MFAAAPAHRVSLAFAAFADPTRLRILNLLRGGELCVCDLISVLDVPQAKVSRHLAYLRRASLVNVRKDGLWAYYALAPARRTLHAKLMECLACCFADEPQLARDAAKLGRLERSGPACCRD